MDLILWLKKTIKELLCISVNVYLHLYVNVRECVPHPHLRRTDRKSSLLSDVETGQGIRRSFSCSFSEHLSTPLDTSTTGTSSLNFRVNTVASAHQKILSYTHMCIRTLLVLEGLPDPGRSEWVETPSVHRPAPRKEKVERTLSLVNRGRLFVLLLYKLLLMRNVDHLKNKGKDKKIEVLFLNINTSYLLT